MKQSLKNITNLPEPTRRVGVIIAKVGVNARVKDIHDRVWIVEIDSDSDYRIGDSVVIRNNVIVSKTQRESTPVIYEV